MTLGELLEGKTLPLRVKHKGWNQDEFFEIHFTLGTKAFGRYGDGSDASFAQDEMLDALNLYDLVEPKKPRLLAWRCPDGEIRLHREGEATPMSHFERVPHLDEPEAE